MITLFIKLSKFVPYLTSSSRIRCVQIHVKFHAKKRLYKSLTLQQTHWTVLSILHYRAVV